MCRGVVSECLIASLFTQIRWHSMGRQEKRQAFDIHVYGQTVLTTVSSVLSPGERARAVKAVKAVEDSEKASAASHFC